jgi:hypothetical protein
MIPIWTPADAREVFERAATFKATEAANGATVVELGEVQ